VIPAPPLVGRSLPEDHSQNPLPLFIRELLTAFAFLARDNYDLSRQRKITRVTYKFIDKERGSESFDTNPFFAGFAAYSGTARIRAGAFEISRSLTIPPTLHP
jgi:hypothetical protein